MIELKDVTIAYDRVILDHASISIPAHSNVDPVSRTLNKKVLKID